MASISAHKDGYRAQVFTLGVRDSKVTRTKREAVIWAAARETEIRTMRDTPPGDRYTLEDLLDRYLALVVPKHKGGVREAAAIKALKRRLADIHKLDTVVSKAGPVLEMYRDLRLETVAEPTVLREIKYLGVAFEEAKAEWKWLETNPVRAIRKPSSNPHRDRTISRTEIKGMLREMGYPRRKNGTCLLFLLALRTGMRAGEMCQLTWDRVFEKHVYLAETKTKPRAVPLSKKARRVLSMAKGRHTELVFGLKETTLSGLFIRYRKRSGLEGFRFHDTRHTAATWMSEKVDVMTLCKIFGWTDPKMAMVYYNPKASDIADKL